MSSVCQWGVGSTVACESALRSAGTLLSRVRAPLPAPWPDGGPESLRSPCCGLAIYKKLKLTFQLEDLSLCSPIEFLTTPTLRLILHYRVRS
ncbi:hypothetical protein PoB_007450300 [Plakobranchus ocellatus]|uniref:Uncharacterized protein n=1 Tax=Plakobranchus ocellatus TaxID=259542 RepID=A0AAV4DUF9_9GAST|nr:hypothetical protein PoB_007450300 [Plakobranchus ocellatus]